MKSKPIRKYAQPKYPTRLEVAARPVLLRRHQPPAWRKWPELTGAAGLFLLADATRLLAADSPPKGGQTLADAKALAVVAPIFQHGEGRGSTGCIVMSPPVFLSEEEALQVIREELGKSGVKASQTNFIVPGVKIKPGLGEFNQKGDKWEYLPATEKPLLASAADPKQKVAVKFVSERNYHHLGAPASGSTVQSYDLKALATSVAAEVQKQGQEKLYFGTFYDPLTKTLGPGTTLAAKLSPGEAKSSNTVVTANAEYLGNGRTALTLSQPAGNLVDARAESRRLLRLQVQDFLKWLQAQGAI